MGLVQSIPQWLIYLVRHPATREGLTFGWCRIIGSGARLLLVRWALLAEMGRAGLAPPRHMWSAHSVPLLVLNGMLSGVDVNFVGSLIDALVMRNWSSPALTWYRVPTVAEVELADVDMDAPAQSQSSKSSRRRQPAPANTRWATGGSPDTGSPQTQGAGMFPAAATGSINAPPAPAPPTKAQALVRSVRHRAEILVHATCTAIIVVGLRRECTTVFRALSWGSLAATATRLIDLDRVSVADTDVARRAIHRLRLLSDTADGYEVLEMLFRHVPAPGLPRHEQSTCLRTLFAGAYPGVAQGVVTLLGLLWLNNGGASAIIPWLRRSVFRPIYRRWPRLRTALRKSEGVFAVVGPRIFFATVTAPFATLKYRLFAAALLENPYTNVTQCAVATASGGWSALRDIGATVVVHLALGVINEIDVPGLLSRGVVHASNWYAQKSARQEAAQDPPGQAEAWAAEAAQVGDVPPVAAAPA